MINGRKGVEKHATWFVLCLLLLFFGRLLQAASVKSVTYDEVLHIFYGVFYWQHGELYSVVQNPTLINAVIGLPVSLLFHPNLPPELGDITMIDWREVGKAFMWESNSNGLRLIWTARLTIMLLATGLGALLYHWSQKLYHSKLAGLLALVLYTFDPNILAHSHLATTDLGTTFFFFLAAYLVWRYWQAVDEGGSRPGHYLAAAAGIGALLAAKFSGIIIVPALLLMALYRLLVVRPAGKPLSIKRTGMEVVGWLLIGGLILLISYRFQLAPLKLDFIVQQEHQQSGHSAFLLGRYSQQGWWYYFPVLSVFKTTLAVLVLTGLGLCLFVTHRPRQWQQLWPLLLAAGIGGAGLTSHVNIGYRYLLPLLPLLYLSLAQLARPGYATAPLLRWSVTAALAVLVLESFWIHPHYLSYFNLLAGGPANGWRIAVDSNLDWGQDLQLLAEAQQENGWPTLRATWLGTAPPSAYDLEAHFLPGWPWKEQEPFPNDFYPDYPAPGLYALSATQLQGVYLPDPDYFGWFRQRQPDTRVAYSFFLYQVPTEGKKAAVALSGLGIGAINLADFMAAFKGNNVRQLWYDAERAFIWPGGGGSRPWLAVAEGHWPEHPALRALYTDRVWRYGERLVDGQRWRYSLYQLAEAPSLAADFRAQLGTVVFSQTLQLLGYQPLWPKTLQPGQAVELLSYWRVRNPTAGTLKLFVHLIDEQGRLVAQHDGLDVLLQNLQPGDEIVQLHSISLPADEAGTYQLRIGLYDTTTMERLVASVDGAPIDSLRLQKIDVLQ